MRPDDRIDEWARARARVEVPADFADRVAARAPSGETGRSVPALLRIAAVAGAAAAGLARVAAALAVFSASCGVAP